MEKSTNSSGLRCPNCEKNIKLSFEDLLFKNKIECPFCLMEMDMTVPTSIKHHLQEIMMAEKNVNKTKSFNR
jgi:C4-type Zn-finger protein